MFCFLTVYVFGSCSHPRFVLFLFVCVCVLFVFVSSEASSLKGKDKQVSIFQSTGLQVLYLNSVPLTFFHSLPFASVKNKPKFRKYMQKMKIKAKQNSPKQFMIKSSKQVAFSKTTRFNAIADTVNVTKALLFSRCTPFYCEILLK